MDKVNTKSMRTGLISILALGLILALSSVAFAQVTPKVIVKDQPIVNGTVTIERVDAAQDGWLVVHAQASGNPGPDLGHAAVKAGTNENVVVQIDASKATPVLYAMLHVDLGEKGVYEFPGPDVPVEGPQEDVNPTFHVIEQTAAAATTAAAPSQLPTTGGASSLEVMLLGLGVLCVAVGFGLSRRQAFQHTED